MASSISAECSEAREGSFSLLSYQHAPAQQLLYQPLTWHSTEVHGDGENLDENDPELSSADEGDYAMEINTEKRGIGKDTIEDIEEKHLEPILEPTTSHGLPLPPNNFEPLKDDNYTRDWKFPLEFETGPRVCPPQQCTDECGHGGEGDGCVDGDTDPGIFDLSAVFYSGSI